MAAGDPTARLLLIQTDAGAAVTFANAAAFTAAGFAITFKDYTGATLSPQPTYTVASEGNGLHRIGVDAEPSPMWYGVLTVPSGYFTDRPAIVGDGSAYTLADLAALILATIGSPTTNSGRVEGAWDDWIEGDYFYQEVTIPAAKTKVIGAGTSLSGVTVTAGAKQPFPTKQSADPEQIDFTVDVLDASARLVAIRAAWDSGYALGSNVQRRSYIADVSIAKSGKRVTSNRYTLDIAWQADPRP